jgi:hypothetical protein
VLSVKLRSIIYFMYKRGFGTEKDQLEDTLKKSPIKEINDSKGNMKTN